MKLRCAHEDPMLPQPDSPEPGSRTLYVLKECSGRQPSFLPAFRAFDKSATIIFFHILASTVATLESVVLISCSQCVHRQFVIRKQTKKSRQDALTALFVRLRQSIWFLGAGSNIFHKAPHVSTHFIQRSSARKSSIWFDKIKREFLTP